MKLLQEPQHMKWRLLRLSDILSTRVWASTGTHERRSCLTSSKSEIHLFILTSLSHRLDNFLLRSGGWGGGGDNQRSAFSSHSHQQRRDARHAQHKSDKVKVIIKKCFFALLLTDPTQQDSFCSVKPTVQQRRTYSIKTFLHNMKTSSVKPGRSIWTSA